MLNVGAAERPFGVAAASGAVTPTDPFWANVVLLVGNNNGADGTTTFTDQSAAPHTMTGVGNAQWDDAQAPTGLTSSILLDGSGDYITTPASADWGFGTGDVTIEVWGRIPTANNFDTLFARTAAGFSTTDQWIFLLNAGRIEFWTNAFNGFAAPTIAGTTSVLGTSFIHLAYVRDSGTNRLFVNGTSDVATNTNAANITSAGAPELWLGNTPGAATRDLNGHIAAARITKAARYTANFTPPTLPLPTS